MDMIKINHLTLTLKVKVMTSFYKSPLNTYTNVHAKYDGYNMCLNGKKF